MSRGPNTPGKVGRLAHAKYQGAAAENVSHAQGASAWSVGAEHQRALDLHDIDRCLAEPRLSQGAHMKLRAWKEYLANVPTRALAAGNRENLDRMVKVVEMWAAGVEVVSDLEKNQKRCALGRIHNAEVRRASNAVMDRAFAKPGEAPRPPRRATSDNDD